MGGGVAASVCVIHNQSSLLNYAIQYDAPSNLSWNSSGQPVKLHVNHLASSSQNLLFFTAQMPSQKKLVISLANNSRGPNGRWCLSKCTDDPVIIHPQDGSIISEELEGEAITSMLRSSMATTHDMQGSPEHLIHKLKAVRLHILAMEPWNASRLKVCHRNYVTSAINLIHYLALKSLDFEQLQRELSSCGLLSLATINMHVLASLSASIHMLEANFLNIQNRTGHGVSEIKSLDKNIRKELTSSSMIKKALTNNNLLLGTLHSKRTTHIMVTVGQEAAESDTLIADLISAGTTIFRINCAHGNQSSWMEIIRKIKKNSRVQEKPCRILMDLAGPKFRTGKLKAGPEVVKISPKKDALGSVIYPARVWLAPTKCGQPPAHVSPDVILNVDGQDFLSKLEVDNVVIFSDARGKQRTLKITGKFPVFSGVGLIGECSKTAYVESGTKFCIKDNRRKSPFGVVVDVPPVEYSVRLKVGDLLLISRDDSSEDAEPIPPATNCPRVTSSSGYLFDSVKPGESIAFDDGKIWGVIKGTSSSEIVVSITRAGQKGTKLGSDKSINIPESNIRYQGLTSKDIVDLDFVAAHADMVGISFVRNVDDIVVLRQELAKRNIQKLGVVLKIETRGGFEKLPLMLLEAMRSPNPLGVMIARGDLAVECGWDKLGNIQEEILSVARAAHVPVIWATQVLETLIKCGIPTRAEITDVSVGKRANCIMLNKGKHITEAVSTLDTILSSHCLEVKIQ